ncbi:MAG: HipA N-terminal domain-containing protein [Bacteroidales bacterium]|nr:HipA N-terminal domain-containing protein [Bacteroidales bacterium]
MRKGTVFMNGTVAGTITEIIGEGYVFEYDDGYLSNPSLPAISLTLPKVKKTYTSATLFPFFANMLSEGANRTVQARLHHVDRDDDFGILLATASVDTPGAVTIMKVDDD